MLDLNTGLRDLTFHMTGGNRVAQGTYIEDVLDVLRHADYEQKATGCRMTARKRSASRSVTRSPEP